MSRFNTGNPIGSGSPLDLDDNAKNLDVLVNSAAETNRDRFGRSRLSYQGMENKYNRIIDGMGLYPAEGSFETGGTITERNQYLTLITAVGEQAAGGWSWGGTLPKTVTAGSTPETSGGIGPDAWVYRSDTTVRAALADGSADISGVTAEKLVTENNPLAIFDFAADGSTNDTASFELLEADFAGRDVDLLGKIYLVDRYFTGCNYFNGKFRVVGDTIPTTNFSVGKEQNPNTEARNLSDVTLKSKSNDSRYTVPDGIRNSIVLLGDSISHGAYQGELYKDGWVNVFKRMCNAQTGSKSYGFAPLLTLSSGSPTSREVHSVSFSGGNAFVFQESTSGGADVLQGLALQSSQAGDSVSIECPTFMPKVRVWFIRSASGGVFSYSVNGATAINVDTSGADDLAASIIIDMTDNRKGKCNLELEIVSGTVRLCGVGYEHPVSGNIAGNTVQNFSQSGRRLYTATESLIETACKGAALMLCLGHNDQAAINATPALAADFSQRIDWVIKYCLKYNTSLIVPDFCWATLPDGHVRKELRRAAAATTGLYIPLPDYLYRDQMLKTEYSSLFYQVSTLGFFVDVSHPSAAGAKWLAETISKAMGLSVNGKREALAHHDFPWPLIFDPAGSLENNFTTYPNISFVKRNGDILTVSARLRKIGGGTLAIGSYPVNLSFNSTNSRQMQFATTVPFDTPTPMALTNTDEVFFAVVCGQTVNMTLRSVTPYLSTFNFSLQLALDSASERS